MTQFVFFNCYCVVDLFQSWRNPEWITMKMRLKLTLLMEVKEKSRDGNMLGYLMKKI